MNSHDSKSIEIRRRIHLGRMLGEGGIGRVVDGFAGDLGQYLAVKQLRPELIEDHEVRARFEEEAAIMASIDHPGVLPVYGLGIDDEGQLSYVMKKVEGKTLTLILWDPREPVTSVPRRNRLLGILLNVCETVASAHDKGIIHRDIKPENILIDREESVYVIDWGLAKRTGTASSSSAARRTMPGNIMGTPGYMAPEQADGRSADAGTEADVFALGAILYEILTDKRPFAADDDRAEMLGSIHQNPEHPRRINVLLPRDICAVCLKALNKNPAARYPNARGLADDIRAHLEGRPVTAIRPNLIERVRYAARQRPMRALVIASLLVALGILAAFIGTQRWADHRLADKALERIDAIDAELAELETESKNLQSKLAEPDLQESERVRTNHEIGIIDSRWVLGQFEALRVLNSVSELRFIRTSSKIQPLTRQRLLSVIHASIDRGKPALAEALIATLLVRNEEGTLEKPLTREDVKLLKRLAADALDAASLPNH
ncbi:MAG: serine/threonine protein kinase [Akkermansiaceae bacterium]|jgi:serine/threonine-protein kinase|nr:serine/threonine protein kinase [Akkermansiaceae bacterium]MCU0779236.1 serine/threonine protein kinase [Akkermansiaceae bacterium]